MTAWLGFAAAFGLLAYTAASVVKTFMIPHATRAHINRVMVMVVYGAAKIAATRVNDLERRERIYALVGPVYLVSLLATWLACLLLGFALLLWPSAGSFPVALRESGSSLFTLGFAVPAASGAVLIAFVAAASGLAVLALLIAYLPLLYAAYNRREMLVTTLEALAGAPPWGPELLARQALIDNVAALPSSYARWTEWAADIAESHVNYRALIAFRSSDPSASWLLSLLAVLDGAAMHLALNPQSAPHEARPLLRVGYLAMRKIAANLDLAVPDDPGPDDPVELTRAEFDEAVRWLRDAGWQPERSADEAWPQFRGWRVNYEAAAYRLALYLDLPPALWSGPRRPGRPAAAPPHRPADRQPGEPREPA